MSSIWYALLISFAVAYILTPLVRKIALKHKIVAMPGGRRAHAKPTPLLGGISMYFGFTIAVLIASAIDGKIAFDKTFIGLLVSGSFIALIGALDDVYELPGWAQAGAIVLGGAFLTFFGVQVYAITYPFKGGQTIPLHLWGIPVTIIWILMVTKAVDCVDGVDGLAAGISVIIAVTLLAMALATKPKNPDVAQVMQLSAIASAALVGAAFGFLRFNYPPAKIFMGTIDAQFLGFMLAGISVVGAFKMTTFVAIGVPIIALGVPLFDTAFVVIRRLATGRKIHEADRTHLHHRLIDKGFSSKQVIWSIYGMTAILCALAYILYIKVR
jgi:UDP-GlcNAc:undecaprenyl-phosphate/decaprenyl-phosphate GlcNAc-1-phosphate transferase